MIDWPSVGFGALWILGLSLELAAFSFAHYRAREKQRRLVHILGEPGYRSLLSLGMFLFCLGMAGTASSPWQGVVWAALALAFGLGAWTSWQRCAHG